MVGVLTGLVRLSPGFLFLVAGLGEVAKLRMVLLGGLAAVVTALRRAVLAVRAFREKVLMGAVQLSTAAVPEVVVPERSATMFLVMRGRAVEMV
jgi:hypothetical protein